MVPWEILECAYSLLGYVEARLKQTTDRIPWTLLRESYIREPPWAWSHSWPCETCWDLPWKPPTAWICTWYLPLCLLLERSLNFTTNQVSKKQFKSYSLLDICSFCQWCGCLTFSLVSIAVSIVGNPSKRPHIKNSSKTIMMKIGKSYLLVCACQWQF